MSVWFSVDILRRPDLHTPNVQVNDWQQYEDDIMHPRLWFSGNCTLLPIEGEPDKFLLGGMEMDCAPGSTFDYALCTCAYVEPRK